MSAHRTPAAAAEFAKARGGKRLRRDHRGRGHGRPSGGQPSPRTPCCRSSASPCKGGAVDGLDALLATVQMPSGIPVATVALNGAKNAAVLAAQMLAIHDARIAALLAEDREEMARSIAEKDAAIRAEAGRAVRNAFQISFYFYKTQKREKNNMEKTGTAVRGESQERYSPPTTRTWSSWITRTTPPPATAPKKGTIRGKGVVNNRLVQQPDEDAGGKGRAHPLCGGTVATARRW